MTVILDFKKWCKGKLIVFFVFLSLGSFAQDIAASTLLWEADQVTDLQTQATLPYACKFKTQNNQPIEWIQKKGARTSSYVITGTVGTWTDISAPGMFTYLVSKGGNMGKMTMEKSLAGIFITVDLSKVGGYTFKQRFRIKSVQPAN
jgi:hypothetical protein